MPPRLSDVTIFIISNFYLLKTTLVCFRPPLPHPTLLHRGLHNEWLWQSENVCWAHLIIIINKLSLHGYFYVPDEMLTIGKSCVLWAVRACTHTGREIVGTEINIFFFVVFYCLRSKVDLIYQLERDVYPNKWYKLVRDGIMGRFTACVKQ